MAGRELTDALALLLSDAALRARFATDPVAVARGLELTEVDAMVLAALDPAALEEQARVLLGKRRGEVSRLAPATWALQAEEGTARFAEYAADSPWPAGHLRHPLDARAFLRWLAVRGLPCDRLELLRLEARLGPARRCIALVPSRRTWRPPALYLAWRGRRRWHERLLSLGEWRG